MPKRCPHFTTFKKEVARMQLLLGLQDWHITCSIGTDNSDNAAELHYNFNGKRAEIAVNPKYARSPEAMRTYAQHEMAHLLLTPITWRADNGFCCREGLADVEESIVRVLEKVLSRVKDVKLNEPT